MEDQINSSHQELSQKPVIPPVFDKCLNLHLHLLLPPFPLFLCSLLDSRHQCSNPPNPSLEENPRLNIQNYPRNPSWRGTHSRSTSHCRRSHCPCSRTSTYCTGHSCCSLPATRCRIGRSCRRSCWAPRCWRTGTNSRSPRS